MNTEPLLQVKEEILADPESFVMEDYFSPCGTQMCIAGRLAYNAGWRPVGQSKLVEHELFHEYHAVEEVAAEILGVSEKSARRLFHVGEWPRDLAARYHAQVCASARAKIGMERIDRFITVQQELEKDRKLMEYLPRIPELEEFGRRIDFEVQSLVESDKTCAVV